MQSPCSCTERSIQATLENTVWSERGLDGGTGADVLVSKAAAAPADTSADSSRDVTYAHGISWIERTGLLQTATESCPNASCTRKHLEALRKRHWVISARAERGDSKLSFPARLGGALLHSQAFAKEQIKTFQRGLWSSDVVEICD